MDDGARTADGDVTELATALVRRSGVGACKDYGGDIVCRWVVGRGDCFDGGGARRLRWRPVCCWFVVRLRRRPAWAAARGVRG
jgi:hypothetical protein